MWTNENRSRYDRNRLRYPSDLTDAEWAQVEPLIPPAKRGGNRRHVDEREVVNGLMYVLSTGCQWRAVPKDLPPRSTLYDYFDRWSWDGTPLAAGAEDVHQAVDDLALIDMTSVAGALGRRNKRLDMRPFRLGQIARIAQPTAVVASAIFVGPHRRPPK